jgi:hypothetical protein
MFMVYLHTKFHVTNSDGSLNTAIKMKAKNVRSAAMFLSTIYKKITLTKVANLSVFYYHVQNHTIAALVSIPRRKFASPPFYYQSNDYRKLIRKSWGGLQWHNFSYKVFF